MNKKKINILILIIFSLNIFSKADEDIKKMLERKGFELLKKLNAINSESDIKRYYVKDRKYFEHYRRSRYELGYVIDEKNSYNIDFEDNSFLPVLYRMNTNKKYESNKSQEEIEKKARNYIRILRPDIDPDSCKLLRILTPKDTNFGDWGISYYRVVNDYPIINEHIYISIFQNGKLYDFSTSFTKETCEVKVNVSRKEAEDIAVNFAKKRVNLFLKLQFLLGNCSIELKQKVLKGRNGWKFDLSKPVLTHPRFFYSNEKELKEEIKNGLLKGKPDEIIENVRWGGIDELRPVWVIPMKAVNFFFYGDEYFSINVDTETGKIL